MTRRVRRAAVAVGGLLLAGSQELTLSAGLALLTGGLWGWIGPLALVAPGLVLVWIALPQRHGFVVRPPRRDE